MKTIYAVVDVTTEQEILVLHLAENCDRAALLARPISASGKRVIAPKLASLFDKLKAAQVEQLYRNMLGEGPPDDPQQTKDMLMDHLRKLPLNDTPFQHLKRSAEARKQTKRGAVIQNTGVHAGSRVQLLTVGKTHRGEKEFRTVWIGQENGIAQVADLATLFKTTPLGQKQKDPLISALYYVKRAIKSDEAKEIF